MDDWLDGRRPTSTVAVEALASEERRCQEVDRCSGRMSPDGAQLITSS